MITFITVSTFWIGLNSIRRRPNHNYRMVWMNGNEEVINDANGDGKIYGGISVDLASEVGDNVEGCFYVDAEQNLNVKDCNEPGVEHP